MLTKLSVSAMPTITKTVNGVDVSQKGAFAFGEKICFTVTAPRRLGASAVVLRLCRDGESDVDRSLAFVKTECGVDTYECEVDTGALCEEEGQGLFFYEFLFLRGANTLFTSTKNQVDFTLIPHSAERFALLVYEKEYTTPEWFRGKVMYHIFVDRFYCGKGEVAVRDDVVMNPDWENGIPQYPKKNGDALANNMFFGGNLWGIAEKLEYLQSLGVEILYLSPIFRAYSNHKYDTGDYLEIDGMFGGQAAFEHLLKKAKKMGMRVILDGVFNHTGDNSRYFDRYGAYGNRGAFGDPKSPYRDWFCFKNYPLDYETWWGIQILPKLNPNSESCRKFLAGRGGVAEKYVAMGIGGWRLDVADELTNAFLDDLRQSVKEASDGDAVIIGEVWENGALKEAYGKRRRYFRGRQLDSVMNYPLRTGILQYILEQKAELLANVLKEIYATYPKCVCDCLMNLLGTHDTERILTVLGEGKERVSGESNDTLSKKRLTEAQYDRGVAYLKLAATIQYTVYGVPSVFYGDEAGLEGYHDPFCRRPYPWGKENRELLEYYRTLGKIRQNHSVFTDGSFHITYAKDELLSYVREGNGDRITVLVNVGEKESPYAVADSAVDLLTDSTYGGVIPPRSAVILQTTIES